MTNIGKKLKDVRREYGFTQEQVASGMGISARTLARYEKGESIPRAYMEDIIEEFVVSGGERTRRIQISREKTFPEVVPFLEKRDLLNFKDDYLNDYISLPIFNYSRKDDESDYTSSRRRCHDWKMGRVFSFLPLHKDDLQGIGKINEELPPFGYRLEESYFNKVGIPKGSLLIVNPNKPFTNGDLCLLSFKSTLQFRWIVSKEENYELHTSDLYTPVIVITEKEIHEYEFVNYGTVVKVITSSQPKSYFMQG